MRFDLAGVVFASSIASTLAASGKTYTTWDCCKPACSWSTNLGGVQGVPAVCDLNNKLISNNALTVKSGCDSGGQGYLCDRYVPSPVADDLAYGFAAMGAGNCCKCFQLQWTSGSGAGKRMVVQAIDITSGGGGSVANSDIVILTPGGGTGPYDTGCRAQYGTSWGNQNGGVNSGQSCQNLPQNLQGGCYWRFNWARGDVNGWNMNYQQVSCPSKLTSVSGCSA